MGNLGSGELLVIFFVALIVLGPNKLPDAARQVGRAVAEIRRISGGFQREMREAMREPLETVDDLKNAATDPFGSARSSAAPNPTRPHRPTTPKPTADPADGGDDNATTADPADAGDDNATTPDPADAGEDNA